MILFYFWHINDSFNEVVESVWIQEPMWLYSIFLQPEIESGFSDFRTFLSPLYERNAVENKAKQWSGLTNFCSCRFRLKLENNEYILKVEIKKNNAKKN